MGISSSIQFRDSDSVCNAFENRKVAAWSISQGKQFMFKGVGNEDFKAVVDQLEESFSSATYTVRVYEDISDIKQIKSNTADDGSFNFKFNEDQKDFARQNIGYAPNRNDNIILSKLTGIEERLRIQEESVKEEDSVGENRLGIIGELLEHPVIARMAPSLIEAVMGFITGKQNLQTVQVPDVNNYPVRNSISGVDEDKIIFEIIEKLKTYDKDLCSHLQKLLLIAENDNNTFNLIVNSLN